MIGARVSWRQHALILLVSGVFFLAQAHWALRVNGATFDELSHIAAGVQIHAQGDHRWLAESGVLPQRLFGLATSRAVVSASVPATAGFAGDVWALSDWLFYGSGADPHRLLRLGRTATIALAMVLGSLVYAWAYQLWGFTGAIVALTLFSFSPTILAHGTLATADMAAALGFTAATWFWHHWLQSASPRTLAASVAATSVLVVSKFSAPVFVVVAIGVAIWRPRSGPRPRWQQFGLGVMAHMVAGFVVVWAMYGWSFEPAPSGLSGAYYTDWRILRAAAGFGLVDTLREWRLLPEAFLYGQTQTLLLAAERPAFMNGSYSLHGWWTFFPYTFVMKTTLAALAFIAVGIVIGAREVKTRPLLVLVLVYGLFAVSSSLNIGHRHLLPIYPALFVLAGSVTKLLHHRMVSVVVVAALTTHVGASLRIAPHYLSFFNVLGGGPAKGYLRLVDSSLDWGQDLPSLAEWLAARKPGDPVYLSYFGSARPASYGVSAIPLPGLIDRRPAPTGEPLRPGSYVLSATQLQGPYLPGGADWTAQRDIELDQARHNVRVYRATANNPQERARLEAVYGSGMWPPLLDAYERLRFTKLAAGLRRRTPDAMAGYSLLIFNLSAVDLRELVGPQPGLDES